MFLQTKAYDWAECRRKKSISFSDRVT